MTHGDSSLFRLNATHYDFYFIILTKVDLWTIFTFNVLHFIFLIEKPCSYDYIYNLLMQIIFVSIF